MRTQTERGGWSYEILNRAETVLDLGGDEGFPALRRRLRAVAAGLLYLVVPSDSRALATPVRVRLLARLAVEAPYRLILVSRDRRLRRWAHAEGVAAFASVERARTGQLPRRPPPSAQRAVAVSRASRGRQVAFGRVAAGVDERTTPWRLAGARSRRVSMPGLRMRLDSPQAALLVGLAAGTLLFFIFAAVLLIPGARVELVVASYPVERSVVLQVASEGGAGDPANLVIAGRTVEVGLAGREQAATAAKRDVPDQPAHGTVIFINRRSEPTVVPPGSVVSTSAGTIIRFQTMEESVVPAGLGAQARVEVEAVEPGLTGNVPALTVNRVEGALALQVGVLNDEPMEGGTVHQAGYVTAEEKARLRSALLQRLRLEGENSLAEGMDAEILMPGSVSVAIQREVYDQPVGAIADLLSLDMRVVVTGLAVSEDELRAATLEALRRDLDPSFQVLEDDLSLLPGDLTSVEGGVALPLTVRGRFSSSVDLDSLRDRLRGLSPSDAVAYLERHLDLSAPPSIALSPGWWGRMPLLPWRIQVTSLPQGQ